MIRRKNNAENFITLRGALMEVDDDGNVTYSPRASIIVNRDQIGAIYEHTVVIMGHKIRVMESLEEIGKKIGMW
jgi:hypothetical protein